MADKEKQLDHLLDSLLANYADAEPRPGFETRLRAVLRGPKPAFCFRWLWAGAAAAVMAVAIFAIYNSRLAVLPPPPRMVPGNANPHPQKSRVESVTLVADVGPRQEVFPTPVPLSEQERL